jgi:hypothetical protein
MSPGVLWRTRVNRFFYWLADMLRPLHDSGLPEELQFPVIPFSKFHRESMLRVAGLSSQFDVSLDIFKFLGKEYALRAARAWRPRELYLMEDLSLAFYLIEEQRQRGILVEPDHIDRFIFLLCNYFRYLRENRTEQEVRERVNGYLQEHSAAYADVASEVLRKVDVDHPLLACLREIDEEMVRRFGRAPGNFRGGLEELGLILDQELDASRYSWCTPNNCRTFAHTGGEGTHFSFLVQQGRIDENSPVVLTTSSPGQSRIVGENLHDFLCFGARRGYFALEQLTIALAATLNAYIDDSWQPQDPGDYHVGLGISERKRQLLDSLIERLELRPWTDPQKYYRLQERYAGLLQLPPDITFFPIDESESGLAVFQPKQMKAE